MMILSPFAVKAQEPQCQTNADFTFSGSGCFPISFTPLNTNPAATHTWDFGDGSPLSNDDDPVHQFPLSLSGFLVTHTIVLNGISYTCIQFVNATCSTSDCPAVETEVMRVSSLFCEYSFDLQINGVINFWDFGDGTTAGNVNPAPHTYTTSGPYTVTANYTINGVTYECSVDIFALCPCDANFTSTPVYDPCLGLSVAFNGACEDPYYYHFWDFGDGCSIEGFSDETITDGIGVLCNTWGTYANPLHTYNINTYNDMNTEVTVTHIVLMGDPEQVTQDIDLVATAGLPVPGIFIGYNDPDNDQVTTLSLEDLIDGGIAPAMPGNPNNFINATDFYIFGNLLVDVDYEVRNSHFTMSRGAAIEVVPGVDVNTLLTINNTLVDADCACLWRWIRAADGCRLRFNNSSTVRDGLFAIYPEGGSNIRVLNSTIANNFVGLFADAGQFALTGFAGNHFTTFQNTTLLNSCGLDESENLNDRGIFFDNYEFVEGISGYAGILLTGLPAMNFPLTNTDFDQITLFDRLINGVVLRNTTSNNLNFFRFSDLVFDFTNYPDESGIGIVFTSDIGAQSLRHTGNNAILNPATNLPEPTFENCIASVLARTAALDTEVRLFESISEDCFGAFAFIADAGGEFIGSEIRDHEINGSITSIVVNNAASLEVCNLRIHDVRIDNLPNSLLGIQLTGNGNTQNRTRIYDNIINTNRAIQGIGLSNWDHDPTFNPTVENNIINVALNGTSEVEGIIVASSDNTHLYCNYINGTYTTGDGNEADGIFTGTSENVIYAQNDITNIRFGLVFEGDCVSQDGIIRTDYIGFFDTGLLNLAGSETGIQNATGNDWSAGGYDSGFGAIHNGSPGEITNSRYFMFAGEIPQFSPPASGWFQPGDDNNLNDCPDPPEMLMMMGFSETDQLIANGDLPEEAWYSEGLNRQLKASLYRRLQVASGEMMATDDNLAAFASTEAESVIGKLYQIESSLAHLADELTSPYQEEINMLHDHIEALRTEIAYIDSLLSLDVEGFESTKATLVSELVTTYTALQEIYGSIHTQTIGAIQWLREENEAIETASLVDENEQRINRIWMDRWLAQTISDEDLEWIAMLAYACPLTNGKPVYLARAIYFEQTGILAESSCEAEDRNSQNFNKTVTGESKLNVYPVPANDLFYIDCQTPEGINAALVVQDMLGNIVMNYNLTSGTIANLPINCEGLPNGIYLVRVLDENRQIAAQKLIIFH